MPMPRYFLTIMSAALLALTSVIVAAQESEEPETSAQSEPPMTIARLGRIIRAIDPDARAQGNVIHLTLADIPVIVIADPTADRMRAMVPIRSAQGLSPEELLRLMQANFDTALDARYAVARGRLWGVFIHPLGPLEKDQLLSALVQTINIARTYGQTYSGGATVFGGGDSSGIYRELLEELQDLGEEI
jgi:hypothetical protein